MKLLENDNITLRAPEPEDLELLYKWENDPQWWSLGNTISPYSHFLLREYIKQSHRDIYDLKQLRLMIVINESKLTVGMIDLYDFEPLHKRAGIGLLIAPDYQNQGIGRQAVELLSDYAFGFLKLHQLYVYIPTSNETCIHLFNKLEYRQTGHLTDWLSEKEGFTDVVVMQKLNAQN